MKKLPALILIAIALTSVATSFTEIPRHVDPSQVSEQKPLPNILLMLYLSIFSNIASLDLVKAKEMLKNVSSVYVPKELRYIFTRFNQILSELLDKINATKMLVDEARRALEIGGRTEAIALLEKARELVLEARAALYTAMDAVTALKALGIPVDTARSKLERCGDAIDALENEILYLLTIAHSIGIEKTVLSIDVEPKKIIVGQRIEVRGCLETKNGKPVSGRYVAIHIGDRIRKVITDATGCFVHVEKVDVYIHRLPVFAEYIPNASDRYRYTYAKSDVVYIDVEFVTPPLHVELSRYVALPGDRIYVKIHTLPNLSIAIHIPFNSSRLMLSSSNSSIEIPINIPLDAADGRYPISVEVMPRGIVGPTSKTVYLEIRRLVPSLRVAIPDYILTGLSPSICIEVSTPSRVLVSIPSLGLQLPFTGRKHCFSISVPLTLLVDKLSIYVMAKPLDPRYRPISTTKDVAVYNTICIASAIALPIPIIVRIARTSRRREAPIELRAREIESQQAVTTSARATDPVIELFLALLNALARIVGRAIARSETLREYLGYVERKLPSVGHTLKSIVLAMERYLYGDPSKVTTSFRVQLIETMRRVFSSLRR